MSFPRYPTYKDSGVAWLGEVPTAWNVKPLYGTVFERNEPNHGIIEDNLLSLSYGKIVPKNIDSNDGLLPESFETYQIVRPGDIILRLTDLQNDKRSLRSAIVEETGIITSAYLAVVPKVADARYMSYLFRAYDSTKVFYSMGGGLRQSMKFDDLKRMPTLVPSHAEQTRIAAFLDRETAKIDSLVAEQQRLIDLLKEKRLAVISHAVTKGLNPAAPMKPSGIEWLGDVPAHWEKTQLYHVTSEIGDGLHGTPEYLEESDYKFINGNNLVEGSIVLFETTRCVSEMEFNKHRVNLDHSTVLLSINGTIGNLALFRGEQVMLGKSAAYINCGVKVDREFLSWFLQSSFIQCYFECAVTGTTIFNLSLESIRHIPLFLPPKTEQAEIVASLARHIGEIGELLHEAQRAIDLLQERRTALISAAVTGQIDVREIASRGDAETRSDSQPPAFPLRASAPPREPSKAAP